MIYLNRTWPFQLSAMRIRSQADAGALYQVQDRPIISTKLARTAIIRAKTSKNLTKKINALIKTAGELIKAVEQLETRLAERTQ